MASGTPTCCLSPKQSLSPEEEDDEDDEDYDPMQDKAVPRSSKRYRMPTPSSHGTSREEGSESEAETPLRPSKRRTVLPVSRLISVDSKRPSLRAKTSLKAKPTAGYPSSDDSPDTDTGAGPQVKYEVWRLQNVILKRVTQDHGTVLQLQFEWDSLVGGQARDHEHVSEGKEHKVKARRRSGVTLRGKRMRYLLISRGMIVASVGMRYTNNSLASFQGGVVALCRCVTLQSSRAVESWRWGYAAEAL